MASPTPGGGRPKMPNQPRVPQLIVDPAPNKKSTKQPKLKQPKLGKDKPYPMPRINDDMVYTQPFPGPGPYSPIKNTKQVNKVYKTY